MTIRSLYFFTRRPAEVTDWMAGLEQAHVLAHARFSKELAALEGHTDQRPNVLDVELGPDHARVLDRPTVVSEAEPEELATMAAFGPTSRGHCFVVDYSSRTILLPVMHAILAREGENTVLVEDEHGRFDPIEVFLRPGR